MQHINKSLFSLLAFCLFHISTYAKIYILLTAALVDNGYYEFRKQQYIRCLEILKEWGYSERVYIVESIQKKGPTFLDDYCDHVFYASVNDATLKNMGINEARTTYEAIQYFGFDDNDIIIKLTGRYEFIDNHFIKFVKQHPKYDMVGRFEGGGIFTLCFAMRCKYLREMYETMDYHAMEHGGPAEHKFLISVETMFGRYVEHKKKIDPTFRAHHLPSLGVKAILTGSTTMSGFDGVTMTF